jgi:Flp pilus assembly protein TadD
VMAEAIEHYRKALGPGSDSPFGRDELLTSVAHTGLGSILMEQGKRDDAIAEWNEAIRINPLDVGVHNNLGAALSMKGRTEEAVLHYQEALRLDPDHADVHNNLGVALEQTGRIDQALVHYEAAARLAPDHAEAQNNVARALVRRGRRAEAVEHYHKAVTLKPDWPEPLNNLGWLLATGPDAAGRNGEEAVRLATRACELTHYKQPEALDTLAAAFAEVGRFSEAVKTAQEGIELARRAGRRELADQMQERLRLYQSSRPYRDRGS